MGSKLNIKCEKCGFTGNVELPMTGGTINAKEGISISNPCPNCGGQLSAPGGKYESGDDGFMHRVGDFQP